MSPLGLCSHFGRVTQWSVLGSLSRCCGNGGWGGIFREALRSWVPVILQLDSPRGLVKEQIGGLPPRVPDSVGRRWDMNICIPCKFPDDSTGQQYQHRLGVC